MREGRPICTLLLFLVPYLGACVEDPGPETGLRPPTCVLSTIDIDLGQNSCGGKSPTEQALRILNVGNALLVYQAALDDTRTFRLLSPASGVVEPGSEIEILISAAPVPHGAAAGTDDQASLILTSNDPQRPRLVLPVRRRALGATLTAAAVNFGDILLAEGEVTRMLAITNQGNQAALVSLTAPSSPDFSIAWDGAPSPVLIQPGATWQGATVRFLPRAIGAAHGETELVVQGAVCGTLSPISLGANVASGIAVVSPRVLDFGNTPCGAIAEARSVEMRNVGNGPYTFQATLGRSDSPYQLSTAQGTVAPGGTLRLLVTPRPIPDRSEVTRNLYGDTLTVSTSAPGDAPHVIELLQGARGAILEFALDEVAFGKQAASSQTTRSVTLRNRGNVGADLTLLTDLPFGTSQERTYLAPNGALIEDVSFTARPAFLGRTETATLAVATQEPLCAPRPSLTVSGMTIDTAAKVAVGDGFVCVLAASGEVYCWGDNHIDDAKSPNGQFHYRDPTPIPSARLATDLVAGAHHVCVLRPDKRVACFGQGPLGNASASSSLTALPVPDLEDVVALASGDAHTCALLSSGQVACFGDNRAGQLGDESFENRSTPVLVFGLDGAIALGAGSAHTCAVRQGGAAFCWGAGYGSAPKPLALQAQGIAGGGEGTCVVADGLVTCWRAAEGTFSPVPDLTDAMDVVRGRAHACAIRAEGGVACVGENNYGQLGDGTRTASLVRAVPVQNLAAVVDLSSRNQSTCATTAGGQLACWGALPGDLDASGLPPFSSVPLFVPGFE